MSSFTSGIPNTGQSLLVTRDPIRNNFSTLNTTISQDHVAMNDADQGKHNQSTYVVQGSDPVTAAGEFALYAKTINSVAQLFGRSASSGTVYQLGGPIGNTATATAGGCSVGTTFQLRWGVCTAGAGAGTTNTFMDGLGNPSPFPNTCFGVIATANAANGNNAIATSAFTVNNFNAASTTGSTGFYIAIGN